MAYFRSISKSFSFIFRVFLPMGFCIGRAVNVSAHVQRMRTGAADVISRWQNVPYK